jgi:hypothetical protein
MRKVKPGSACPRYSLTTLMLAPRSSSTEAYQWRNACIPFFRATSIPAAR